MEAKLKIVPLSKLALLVDILMKPLMYVLSGTFKEAPQCTHRWNNKKFSKEEFASLNEKLMVDIPGDLKSLRRHFLFLFHAPILGGWRNYVVIDPVAKESWYIGWSTELATGVSRIKLTGPVRMLKGPTNALFFGIDAKSGKQIPVKKIGFGQIGDRGKFSKLKLL